MTAKNSVMAQPRDRNKPFISRTSNPALPGMAANRARAPATSSDALEFLSSPIRSPFPVEDRVLLSPDQDDYQSQCQAQRRGFQSATCCPNHKARILDA